MRRHPQWESRLYALALLWKRREFDWGLYDCCTWGAAAVEAVTGTRPDIPSNYTTARGAARVLKAQGGLEATVTERFGPPIPPTLAQRGDLVMFDQGGDARNPGLAVCFGNHFLAPGETGLERVPAVAIRKAWRIGRD